MMIFKACPHLVADIIHPQLFYCNYKDPNQIKCETCKVYKDFLTLKKLKEDETFIKITCSCEEIIKTLKKLAKESNYIINFKNTTELNNNNQQE